MSTILAGTDEVVITPPIGSYLEGYGSRKDASVDVHDDLGAQALILDDGNTRIGILSCDVIGVDQGMAAEVRRLVEERGALPGRHLLIAATHTHGGPRGLIRLAEGVDEALIAVTARKLAGAVVAASRSLRPARLSIGSGTVDSVSQNRRLPDGPIDPTLFVLRVEDVETGRPRAALVNFAMHPTVMNFDNLLITADYPGRVRRVIKGALGGDFVVLFANGACANINPARAAAVFPEVERIGTIVGAEAVRLLAELSVVDKLVAADNLLWGERTPKLGPRTAFAIDAPTLATRAASVDLPLRSFESAAAYAEQIERLKRELQGLGLSDEEVAAIRQGRAAEAGVPTAVLEQHRQLMSRLNRLNAESASVGRRERAHLTAGAASFRTEVQVIQLSSEVAIVGLPGEPVVELGLAIRSSGNRAACLVFGYTNDSIGYVVRPEHYDEGGYEAGRTLFEPSAERILRETALRLLAEVAASVGAAGV